MNVARTRAPGGRRQRITIDTQRPNGGNLGRCVALCSSGAQIPRSRRRLPHARVKNRWCFGTSRIAHKITRQWRANVQARRLVDVLAISPSTEPCAARQASRVHHRPNQKATRTEILAGEYTDNLLGTLRTSEDQRPHRPCIGEQLRQTHRQAPPTFDRTSLRLRERHSQREGGSGLVYPLRRSIRPHVSSWPRPKVGSRISSRRRAASRSTQSGNGIEAVESPRSSHKSSTSRSFSAGGSARSSSVFIGIRILQ